MFTTTTVVYRPHIRHSSMFAWQSTTGPTYVCCLSRKHLTHRCRDRNGRIPSPSFWSAFATALPSGALALPFGLQFHILSMGGKTSHSQYSDMSLGCPMHGAYGRSLDSWKPTRHTGKL